MMSDSRFGRSPDMAGVSLTAHYTAHGWHRLGVAEAERFVTWQGRLLYQLGRPLEALARTLGLGDLHTLLLEPRHRLLEQRLAAAGCQTFVELAAGLSPRGCAYSRDPRVHYIEIDLPAMSALKAALVGRDHGSGLQFWPGNVLDAALYERLATRLQGMGPVAVIAEGLFSYLDRAQTTAVLGHVAALLRQVGGGWLLFDANPADSVHRFGRLGPALVQLVGWVARHPVFLPFSSAEDAAALLQSVGFAAVQVWQPEDLIPPPRHPSRGSLTVLEARIA